MSKSRWRYRLTTTDPARNGRRPIPTCRCELVGRPVYAHLHAPFHTKLARLDLNEESLFNSFLIRTAAELAAATIELLVTDVHLSLKSHHRRSAAVDLLCWDSDHIGHLQTALEQLGLDIESSPLVPVHVRMAQRGQVSAIPAGGDLVASRF